MVELLKDFPPHVAAYRASGTVNRKEYEQVVMARVNEVAHEYGRINFIVYLETGMENYSIKALLDYVKISFEHFSKWERMAIVTDQAWVRTLYNFLGPMVHGTVKVYPLKEFDAAKEWVSGPFEN